MAHHYQRFPWRAFDVELRNLPCSAVVLGCVRGAARISHVESQRAVLEAGESPAVLVSPLIRCTDGTHALRREVRELLEKIVVHGTLADDPHHPAHASCDSSWRI